MVNDGEVHLRNRSAVESPGSLLDQLPAAAAILSADGVPRAWNADAAELLGGDDTAVSFHLSGTGRPWCLRLRAELARSGRGRAIIGRKRNGQRLALEVRARPLPDGDLLI